MPVQRMESSAGAAEADVPMESVAGTAEANVPMSLAPVPMGSSAGAEPMGSLAGTAEADVPMSPAPVGAPDVLGVAPEDLGIHLLWDAPGGDVPLHMDLPFTGQPNPAAIENTLGCLWRFASRLLADPLTEEAGRILRQRYSFFSTVPGSVEALLGFTPVLGQIEDVELVPAPLSEVATGNLLNLIPEYVPQVRPSVDQATLTSDLIAQHGEAQERALTGLFLHVTGVTGADVRACIQNGNLGLFRRPYWRNRELLFQQVGAWLFRCLSSFEMLRKRDLQWEGILHNTEMPTTLVAPNVAAGENHFIMVELLQESQARLRRASEMRRVPVIVPDDTDVVTPTAGTPSAWAPGSQGTHKSPPTKARPSIALLQEAQAKARAMILLNRQVREAEEAERAAQEQEAFQWANRLPPPMPEPPTPSSVGSPVAMPAPVTPAAAFPGGIAPTVFPPPPNWSPGSIPPPPPTSMSPTRTPTALPIPPPPPPPQEDPVEGGNGGVETAPMEEEAYVETEVASPASPVSLGGVSSPITPPGGAAPAETEDASPSCAESLHGW